MRPGRPALPLALLSALVAAGTAWAALTSWRGFLTESSEYLVPLLVCGVIVAVPGALLRRLDTPRVLVVLVQLLLVAAYLSFEVVGTALPTGSTFDAINRSLDIAAESARTYEAPISPDAPPVTPLLIFAGAFFIFLVDVIACTLRRVPVAGLALLAIYSVPIGLTGSGGGWITFVGTAIGFLVMLHLDARDQLLRWGRPLGPVDGSQWADTNPVTDAVQAGAGRIGVAATALALVVPLFVPVLDLDVFGIGPGDGDDDIEIHNPSVDLRRDLEDTEDIPLLRVTTDDPDPEYLRTGVLALFTGDIWTSGNRDVSTEDRATGELPDPEGLSPSVPTVEYESQIETTDEFDSWWLPAQYPASSVVAEGDWRFDPDTMDFLASDEDDELTAAGLSYSMTAIEPDYGLTGTYFSNATPGSVAEEFLEVPGGLPSDVRNYAQAVTGTATNDYERAIMLQNWFRDEFRYSVRKAPEGVGGGTFETFLNKGPEGRIGYCEQFASAMAAMARTLGIPARVAIGFLSPSPIGDGVWEYSSKDLHAWPELYFEGAGWVRFEPTPSRRARTVPDYTRVPVNTPSNLPTGGPTSNPSDELPPSDRPSQAEPSAAPEDDDQGAGSGDDGGVDLGQVLTIVVVALLAVVLLVLLILTPRTVRAGARRRRLAGGPDDVWEELHATAIDLDVPWPSRRSPREVGAALVEHVAHDVVALERVLDAVERARYARPGAPVPEGLAEDGATCVAALEAGVTPRVRRRAKWLPRSLRRGELRASYEKETVGAGR
jgi:transglutaminase-like putative cysteine protease